MGPSISLPPDDLWKNVFTNFPGPEAPVDFLDFAPPKNNHNSQRVGSDRKGTVMNLNVLRAVLVRNVVSYFTNATGYLFICVFVLLSSFAAFWPNDFFNANLANLDQLNKYFAYIMLIFIPAITMSIWAEERHEGTDELLLTIPAGDLDIVLGKYLAAVAIITVALLFSLATNFLVLGYLGNPDWGQLLATYFGYWLIGLAMLAIGMVASFLTPNLTVAYILGAVLNAPLVFASLSDTILPTSQALIVKYWSISQRFADFGHGVISLGGVVYFLAITVVMIYLSIVLIGRRNWIRTGRGGHYLIRTLALGVAAVAIVVLCQRYDTRADWTENRLSSLALQSQQLLKDIESDRPVAIEAFVSPQVPETYIQTKLNLLNTLREIQAYGGGKVQVRITEAEKSTEEAARAEARFRIMPREVVSLDRGTISTDRIFLGVAIRCGLNRVTIPFFDRGIPIEYELIRSICTVLEERRKTIGVLLTDAKLFGQFNPQAMSAGPNWPIIDELQKQYEVVRVDPKQPIDMTKIDALLAVQPSSLGPAEMDNFVAAVGSGLPTAIFEDPAPLLSPGVPGTNQPRRAPQQMQMMMQRQQAPPKGDLKKLWDLLGVDFSADMIVWQDFNPYPKAQQFPDEFVFIDPASGAAEPFSSNDSVTAGLQQVLLPFPGLIKKRPDTKLTWEPLVVTGEKTGTVGESDMQTVQMTQSGPARMLNPARRAVPTGETYQMVVRIGGQVQLPVDAAEGEKEKTADKKSTDKKDAAKEMAKLNVILAADVDMLSPGFFQIRQQGEMPQAGLNFHFQNVTLVLNILDSLAGDNRFIDIRKRRRSHPTLTAIESKIEDARARRAKEAQVYIDEFDETQRKEQEKLQAQVVELERKMKDEKMNLQEIVRRVAIMQQGGEKRMKATIERLERQRDRKLAQIDIQLQSKVRKVQDRYKMVAVFLPPILPLLLALIVFFIRRAQEREGVDKSRLR
jgi:ABC-type transport system involved in multi-copper enzyme maturation permease subunit/ABC-type uncharacterized transport system involved in gliding motility auxiliary subunit